jgi:hypothetical protein
MPLPVITPDAFFNQIPQANDDPSDSQSLLLSNNSSVNAQFGYDHTALTAGVSNGFHTKVSFSGNNPPIAPNTPAAFESITYTKAGTADVNSAQLFWQNAQTEFHLSMVRAWGVFNGGGAFPVTPAQSFNVTQITQSAAGRYTITLVSDAVASSDFGVIAIGQVSAAFTTGSILGIDNRTFNAGVGTFDINSRSLTSSSGVNVNPITFVVLQL